MLETVGNLIVGGVLLAGVVVLLWCSWHRWDPSAAPGREHLQAQISGPTDGGG